MNRKQFKLKENQVLTAHTYKITVTTVAKRGKRIPVWQTRMSDGRRPWCYSYEALIELLFDSYYGDNVVRDYSFKNMFELALDEKIATENPKSKTIKDYQDVYRAFISDELCAKDIRKVALSELKAYI